MTLKEKLEYLAALASEIDDILKTSKKDAAKVQAFKEDFLEAVQAAKTDEEKAALITIPYLLAMKLAEGVSKFKWYDLRSYDVTRNMRRKADEIAVAFGFTRYKEVRGL